MSVELPNSYGCFALGDLLKDSTAQNMWSHTWNICTAAEAVEDTVEEKKPVFKKQRQSEEHPEHGEAAPSEPSGLHHPKIVLPPPPAAPVEQIPDDDEEPMEYKKWNTKGLSARDWWVINQHNLDREAVRALTHLADERPDAKDAFVDKLVSKLDKGDLRKPSNFVITCVRNALFGGEL